MMRPGLLRYFVAIVLIGIGVFLVLDNLDIIDSNFGELWHYIYPTFFIVLGFRTMVRFFKKGGGSGWIGGSFLIIYGTFLILGRLEFTTFEFGFWDVFKLWPLLIVYFGFSLVSKTFRGFKVQVYKDDKKYDSEDRKWGTFTSVGSYSFEKENWRAKPMNVFNAAGDYFFDFTKAFIPDENIPITIKGWAGEVRMLIPENIPCQIKAKVKAGNVQVFGESSDGIDRSVFYESPDYETATQKLTMDLDFKAG